MTGEWQTLGRKYVELYTLNQLIAVETATYDVVETIREGGNLTKDQICELRTAVVSLQVVIEEDIPQLTDDAEPYNEALHHILYDVLTDYLNLVAEKRPAGTVE